MGLEIFLGGESRLRNFLPSERAADRLLYEFRLLACCSISRLSAGRGVAKKGIAVMSKLRVNGLAVLHPLRPEWCALSQGI
jgi:hypothetical protein